MMEDFEEMKKSVAEYHLTSDLFAGKVFEDLKASQELCRIFLQNDKLVLRNVKTQYVIRNLKKHSVELDILAEDIERNFINIEIQMYQENAPLRRSRYYLSSIDMDILEKGKPYQSLPDVTIIYLTRLDFIGDKRGRYDICRKPDGQDVTMRLENGLHEKYYNLEYPTEDMRVNELLRYFQHSDPFYETENFPAIVERVKFFKVKEEGVTIMCEIADRIRREGKIEGKIEDILELLEDFGKVPERLIERISREAKPEQLSKWLKYAAKASSLAEFEARMNV